MVEETGGIGIEHPQIWDYDTRFREYALLLGRKGPDALESVNRFPERITLNNVWHGALDRMRDETKSDLHERYSLITYDETTRDFQFSEISAKGEHNQVPTDVIKEEIRKAKAERQATSLVGEIHTHPGTEPFSPEDLIPLLEKSSIRPALIVGIATYRANIFAFRTRETEPINHFNIMPEKFYDFFRDYWLEKAGYAALNKAHVLIPTSFFPNIWKVSTGIAERHRLALYKGKPKEDLVRIHTDKSLSQHWLDLLDEALRG